MTRALPHRYGWVGSPCTHSRLLQFFCVGFFSVVKWVISVYREIRINSRVVWSESLLCTVLRSLHASDFSLVSAREDAISCRIRR